MELAEIRLGPPAPELAARIEALALPELRTLKSAALRANDDGALTALLQAAGRATH